MAIAGLKNLCTPSYVYLVLSIIALIFMAIQNYGNINVYCLGSYSCVVSSTLLIKHLDLLRQQKKDLLKYTADLIAKQREIREQLAYFKQVRESRK